MPEAVDPRTAVALVLGVSAKPRAFGLKELLHEGVERNVALRRRETTLACLRLALLVAVDSRLLPADPLTVTTPVRVVVNPPHPGAGGMLIDAAMLLLGR